MMSRRRVEVFPLVTLTGIMMILAAAQSLGHNHPSNAGRVDPIRAVTPSQALGSDPGAEVIEGTWIVDGTDPLGRPIAESLITFSRGGGQAEDSSAAQPSTRNAWHGTWVRTGSREFLLTTMRYLFDSAGNFDGTTKRREFLRVNETADGYTGQFTSERVDRNGNRVNFVTGNTVRAVRLNVESLQ